MSLPMFFWEALKRERILNRVALDVGDNISETIYAVLADFDLTDMADRVCERVKDNVWASTPGEQSA